MPDTFIRSATPGDREGLVALLDRCFPERDFAERFDERYPHLFTDAAIVQHLLAFQDGRLLACVGCYAYDARWFGAPLRVAGIGQVATDPAARGGGVMSRLLRTAVERARQVDFFWLWGDRQRYGRIGFASGGRTLSGGTWDRYLPDPGTGAGIRPLDREADAELIARVLGNLPFAIELTSHERSAMLRGMGAVGWTDGSACILGDRGGARIWATLGSGAAVERLLGWHARAGAAEGRPDGRLEVLADPGDEDAVSLVRRTAGTFSEQPTASIRVGRLRPMLAAWAAAHPVRGLRLPPFCLDGGAAGRVSISCASGIWRIDDCDGTPDLGLAGQELSELLVGFVPAPSPVGGALGALLPMRLSIPPCYAL